jgi:4-amino-4-deoxy-L-arabinose transferase-like glycosyltransferase
VGIAAAPRRRSAADIGIAALAIMLLAVSAAYFYATIRIAGARHLWMDEVLAVSTARLDTLPEIWAAIWKGAEFSPPTYHLLLHGLMGLLEDEGRLVARLPSILAGFGAAVCCFLIARRSLSASASFVVFAVVLASGLFEYAVQARQYAVLAFCLALALLIWDRAAEARRPTLHAVALWFVLSVCISFHFYGVVVVGAVGVAELAWFVTRRRFRVRIWAALALTTVTLAAWAPLAMHLGTYSAGDFLAPDYYAKPTIDRLSDAVFSMLVGGKLGAIMLLAALVLIGAAYLLGRSPLRGLVRADATPRAPRRHGLERIEIHLVALLAIPLIAFAFSFLVTKSFSPRYMSAAALFSGLAAGYALDRLSVRRIVAIGLIPLVAVVLVKRAQIPDPIRRALTAVSAAPANVPLVIGEGLLFIELMEAASPEVRSRLVYLLSPPGITHPDPTNENQARRLAGIFPGYRVEDPGAFVRANPEFHVLTRIGVSTDVTTPALMRQGLLGRPLNLDDGVLIFRAGEGIK